MRAVRTQRLPSACRSYSAGALYPRTLCGTSMRRPLCARGWRTPRNVPRAQRKSRSRNFSYVGLRDGSALCAVGLCAFLNFRNFPSLNKSMASEGKTLARKSGTGGGGSGGVCIGVAPPAWQGFLEPSPRLDLADSDNLRWRAFRHHPQPLPLGRYRRRSHMPPIRLHPLCPCQWQHRLPPQGFVALLGAGVHPPPPRPGVCCPRASRLSFGPYRRVREDGRR